MTPRSVATVHVPDLVRPQPGFETRNIGPANLGRAMDPFINLDDFVMDRPIFRAHPHAGFSAVTYMFEDSQGTFRNRWSMGGDQLIGPGAVHWTQAGRGMLHEEVPTEPGRACHGLQMFVKLPADLELLAPRAFHLERDEVPELAIDGTRVRVLAGTWGAVASPMAIVNDLVWLDVHLAAGRRFVTPATADDHAFVLLVRGDASSSGRPLPAHSGVVFTADGDAVEIESADGAELLYCAGRPLSEPIVAAGPFMMSSQDRLDDAVRRLRDGAMGDLAPSF